MQLDIPAVGILRGVESGFFGELMQASFSSGLQAIEVTMNTDEAERIVKRHRPKVPPGKYLGMGTIRNLDEAKGAVEAGAMFLVSPNLDLGVVEYARSRGIPIVAGALSPTEVYAAWSAGADMIKVFPCQALGGPTYIRELAGPFEQMDLVAVGGVSISNCRKYLDAGAKAVGVSTALFGQEALEQKDVRALARNVRDFVQCCMRGKNSI
jgi:2-dehydro-3-deoxyphosphogluconate aldolase/(4S)-4-hydroxy-2-oxoglutarate aldolase